MAVAMIVSGIVLIIACPALIGCASEVSKPTKAQPERVFMKIVDEVSYYGQGIGGNFNSDPSASQLSMRIKPSNFTGPPHLRQLWGKCFSRVDETYKYEVCPFQNVTQHEQSLRWNPYSGVLGVYQDWEIQNNTFLAMNLAEGDSCGQIFRSAQIVLKCGNTTFVGNVTEPQTCHYRVVLHTPLVCHPHSLLVYPTLDAEHRRRWDSIEDEYVNGISTQQGYNKAVRQLFEDVGYQLPSTRKKELSHEAKEKETKVAKDVAGEFMSLYQCSEEYKKLKKEVEGLRTLVALHETDKKQTAGQHPDLHEDTHHLDDHYPNVNYIDD